ncbi:MAG: phosphoenolpyruvate carboxylase, partial [Gemmataceae bacterium]
MVVMNVSGQDPLATDIRFLGNLLGSVMRRLAGEPTFLLEEEVRAEAKALRASHSLSEARRLRDRLHELNLPDLRNLIRAFTIFFDLVNLAEQQARVRVLRQRRHQALPLPIGESIESALRQLKMRGVPAEKILQGLQSIHICPVFTAHPSEARRRTVLEKLWRVTETLDQRERENLLPQERLRLDQTIEAEIESLWLSDMVRQQRPTVVDEVLQGLRVVEGALFDAVPAIYRKLEDALRETYP